MSLNLINNSNPVKVRSKVDSSKRKSARSTWWWGNQNVPGLSFGGLRHQFLHLDRFHRFLLPDGPLDVLSVTPKEIHTDPAARGRQHATRARRGTLFTVSTTRGRQNFGGGDGRIECSAIKLGHRNKVLQTFGERLMKSESWKWWFAARCFWFYIPMITYGGVQTRWYFKPRW